MIEQVDRNRLPSATERAAVGGTWSAPALCACEPEVLSLIVALLLDREELRAVLAHGTALDEEPWSLPSMITSAVRRIRLDREFAERLCARLSRHAAGEPQRWTPYQALEAWSRRRADISCAEIARILSTLAFSCDPVLTSLAERLCCEVRLEAIQRLHSAGALAPNVGPTRP